VELHIHIKLKLELKLQCYDISKALKTLAGKEEGLQKEEELSQPLSLNQNHLSHKVDMKP
jgi:hypothetical protein